MRTLSVFFSAAMAGLGVSPAYASPIVFQGQNPAVFSGANPGNTAALMASVNRPSDPSRTDAAGRLTPSAIVQQSVLGQISAQINDQIFNGGQASGSFDLGGGSLIDYTRAGGYIVINFTDPVNGRTTITLPDI